MQNTIRTTALLFVVMIISVASTAENFKDLPWQFICVSLGLNWIMMIYFACKLGRFKAVLYPIMFLVNPFMNWIYMVHGVFTAGQRTWGGPRADAAAADAKTTPQQAVEQAIKTGDDLNIVPETFKPAIEARKQRLFQTSLQPTANAENRFVSAGISHHRITSAQSSRVDIDIESFNHSHQRTSSVDMSDSENASVHTPRRVEHLHKSAESA